ncbi:hypothetical protein [Sandaracinus amylolyticus]|uniref:Uncharacterized protein n=1 Tax=Sandaracinus amylolyticus TaxID=927083 RepID=A0A0F6YLK9_9BACT|nr:hypothetical protein [Sandaracinus amylolyticus]AKF08457.1 hypothetical protein DB32_005606 [Sandaracinus amylolyticus]
MSRQRGAGSLTIGSLRGLPQPASRGAAPPPRHLPIARPAGPPPSAPAIEGTPLPPSKRGQRCCRTGCAGCPVGEAIRRARARGTT